MKKIEPFLAIGVIFLLLAWGTSALNHECEEPKEHAHPHEAHEEPAHHEEKTIDDLLDAIKEVESNGNENAVGDNGDSIGAYQIQRPYFEDARSYDSSLRGYKYEDVRQDRPARGVIRAYWKRYANVKRLGREVTFEDMARIHNGGPNGYKKTATEKYWVKVKKELNK